MIESLYTVDEKVTFVTFSFKFLRSTLVEKDRKDNKSINEYDINVITFLVSSSSDPFLNLG